MTIALPAETEQINPLFTLPAHRFWNETVRVPGLFERFRMADDLPNAITCFDRMARHRYWELAQLPTFDSKKTSVVSIFQPKSGGTYLHNRMLELGYHEFSWFFPHRLCHSRCCPGIDALELFMSGGCTCHTHARPEPNILAAFDRAGVEKIWVHLRNPAESAISSFYHYLGEGHGEGSIGELRRQEALSDAGRQGLVPGMNLSEFAVDAIDFFVDWVVEWLQFANQYPNLVVFSYFRELADPQALFARVFSELDIDLGGTITASSMPHDRVRAKRTTNWQSEVSFDARRHIEQRVRVKLEGFSEFAQIWM